MAYNTITTTQIQVGKPTKKELWQKVKDNEDDLDSRLGTVEAGANKIIIFDDLVILGVNGQSLTGIDFWRAPSAFTLLDAKVGIFDVGSTTGTLEMDIQKSVDRDPLNFSTVFTTKPSINYGTASDYDDSTNAVFDVGQTSVSAGDYLRLDISSLPAPIRAFTVFLIGEFN